MPADAQRARIARPLPNNPLDGKPQNIGAIDKPPTFECGGALRIRHAADYIRFGQMLLNGGVHRRQAGAEPGDRAADDDRSSRHRHPEPCRRNRSRTRRLRLRTRRRGADCSRASRRCPATSASYSWNGANGTGFWADPKEQLVVAFVTAGPGEMRKYYREQMQDLVYGALTKGPAH